MQCATAALAADWIVARRPQDVATNASRQLKVFHAIAISVKRQLTMNRIVCGHELWRQWIIYLHTYRFALLSSLRLINIHVNISEHKTSMKRTSVR